MTESDGHFFRPLPKANVPDSRSLLRRALSEAEAVVVGAGAGLSAAAGFTYDNARFDKYFSDFARKYHFKDMYTGGFYPYPTPNEYWAYWSRFVYVNRYRNPPAPLYHTLYELVKDRDYFVVTTNVDHCFQKAGFDKKRLYYTQGDYGLFQCGVPCRNQTYDNEDTIRRMLTAQGYRFDEDGDLYLPDQAKAEMSVPDDLLPRCPRCQKPMRMNLRVDASFVQDEGWNRAASRYEAFLEKHRNSKTLFWELGVGYNTPSIIKYPFWKMTHDRSDAVYACINMGEAFAPDEIRGKAICINENIGEILQNMVD